MKTPLALLGVSALFFLHPSWGGQALTAAKVEKPPTVDGVADDAAWGAARAIVTHDAVADIDITLKAVYTPDRIFFLVRFPDDTENREHKTMVWEKDWEIYRIGPRREDTLVFKWSMEPHPVDLRISSDQPYKADVWYWKSHRTDHAGFADDKYQIYSDVSLSRSQPCLSDKGRLFHLVRRGDRGGAAYKGRVVIDYQGDAVPGLELGQPGGSRADVRAKGRWGEGEWVLEFSRRLDTGHDDDVALKPGQSYQFGVSRFEIAGRAPDPAIEQPNFGSGEISELLTLQFR